MRFISCRRSFASSPRICLLWVLTCWTLLGGPLPAADFHADPQGLPTADGSRKHPWDLATALRGGPEKSDAVQAGDTIWLHDGTYRGGFEIRISGLPDKPIVIRQAPGERATIDCRPRTGENDNGLFIALGGDLIFRDFEVTCSDPLRETKLPGPWPADINRGNVDCRGSRVKFINLVVHDLASGFGFWSEAVESEVYGCLVYHNGWKGPDRGHGHAIYAQNKTGLKRIVDNITFNQFGYGIHCYGSQKAALDGLHLEGNISFNNGCLTSPLERAPGIMVGGECPARRIKVTNNFTFGSGIQLGYPWGTSNDDAVLTDNFIAGRLLVRDFQSVTATGNTIVEEYNLARLEKSKQFDHAGYRWDRNRYFGTLPRMVPFSVYLVDAARGLSLTEWQQTTGFDADSTLEERLPSGVDLFIRPNVYQPGRAHLVVYNWEEREEVQADLSEVLKDGQKYRVQSVQNFYGPPVASGKFDAGQPRIQIPMRAAPPAQPVGMPDCQLPVNEPRFGVFVVLPEE